MSKPVVGIIMGSQSDLKVMKEAANFLEGMKIPFEVTIVSAHRTPKRMTAYASSARNRGLKVIIAGAGGAAHLPGMIASLTSLPVIGVPVRSSNSLDGWDSILSILQMPNGVPVATVALDAAQNAAILATQIIGVDNPSIARKLDKFKVGLMEKVEDAAKTMEKKGWKHAN
jgi:5-(carboxyamino)imidazole ribonucleotide mutase